MLCFVKLGGSLITDKKIAHTPKLETIKRLAEEIATVLRAQPDLRLVIGHGSGSFGHMAASRHGTQNGVRTSAEWQGFAEVWYEARALNQIVVESLHQAGIPVMAFPASACALSENKRLMRWDIQPLQRALSANLVPLLNGDVGFDLLNGGTILSTEDLFCYLARTLKPERILLAGMDEGVWEDFPTSTRLISQVTPEIFTQLNKGIQGSLSVDVTGGMFQKVNLMTELVEDKIIREAIIFSGAIPGNLQKVLSGERIGTSIHL